MNLRLLWLASLAVLLLGLSGASFVAKDEGCSIDPNGLCKPKPPGGAAKRGSGIDPDGGP